MFQLYYITLHNIFVPLSRYGQMPFGEIVGVSTINKKGKRDQLLLDESNLIIMRNYLQQTQLVK